MTIALPAHELQMTVLMTPDTANFSGKVHGGVILRHLDQVAYACASRYAGRYVVTLSVDQVMFRQPIQVGELVTFLASVNHTGRSSMEIGIKVLAEDIRAGVVRHVNSCFFTMVAVDDGGQPGRRWKCARPTRSAATPRPRCAARCGARWKPRPPRSTRRTRAANDAAQRPQPPVTASAGVRQALGGGGSGESSSGWPCGVASARSTSARDSGDAKVWMKS